MTASRPAATRAVVWIALLVFVMIGTLYVLNALEAEYPWINHDVGYHSYLGKEMARGERLYVDLKEDNPPGSPLLLGALYAVADTLGLPDFAGQHLFVLILGAAGLWVLRFALEEGSDDVARALVLLAYVLVVVRGGFSNSIVLEDPGAPYDFGQREHLFSILFLPYLFMRLRRDRAPWWFLPFAALLGWVATFKPFWPPMLVLVEAFVWWRRRVLHPRVPAALFAGASLVFVALALHSRDSLARFLTDNIPMYFRGGYDFYEKSYTVFLGTGLHHAMVAGFAVLLLAAVLAARLDTGARPVVGLFLALAVFAYFAVWHQGKFWSYHTMPFFALTLVPAMHFAGVALGRWKQGTARRVLAAGLAAVLLVGAGATVAGTARMLTRYPPLGSFLCPIVEPYERVMYFSMSVMVQYPPLRLRQEMVGPWTVFLDLPELMALPDPAERDRRIAAFVEELRATIDNERPELLVFSPQGQALPAGATLHDVLADLGALPLAEYRPVSARAYGVEGRWIEGWKLYQRVDARPGPGR